MPQMLLLGRSDATGPGWSSGDADDKFRPRLVSIVALAEVTVVGAGVVGSAVALALGRRGVSVVLLEAEAEPGLRASGTNSGILHTGFDSPPGELETDLILRAAALRDPVLDTLAVPVLRCGAVVPAADGLAANARANGVETWTGDDGALEVPGEAVT